MLYSRAIPATKKKAALPLLHSISPMDTKNSLRESGLSLHPAMIAMTRANSATTYSPAFSNDFAGPQNSMRMRALTSIRLMQTRTFGRYRCALPGTIRSAPNAYTMGTFELLGGIPMAKSSWIRIFPRRGAAKY